MLSGIALNQDIKRLYEKWSGRNTEITEYLDYWMNFFKNYSPITEAEAEAHLQSAEAKNEPKVTAQAVL